jgi:hypothetical protein
MESGFSMDWSDFDRVFERMIRRTAPALGAAGLKHAAAYVISDSINVEPRAPHKTGGAGLWGSQKIQEPVITEDEISVSCGFNIVYAAYQHRGMRFDGTHVVRHYTMAGSGKEFLKIKLEQFGQKYMGITADYIRGNWTTA